MTKQYYDEHGGLVFVSCGGNSGTGWMTVRQRTTRSAAQRINSSALPIRSKLEDAQSDLDAYALKRRWDEAE